MAPLTTAVLLEIKPNVAITLELIKRTKKPREGLDQAMRFSYSSVLGTLDSKFNVH